jgi:hypothetical protein
VPKGSPEAISGFALNFIVNVCFCLTSIKIFTLKIKLNFRIKICHFLKKNVEVPIFFIHRLGTFGSRKLYQKEKKKVGVVI